MELARHRIEKLKERGALSTFSAWIDLRTVHFLERHPERTFPVDLVGWVQEFGRCFWIGDPGPYMILRALLLDGRMPETAWSRGILCCAVFLSAFITLTMTILAMGVFTIFKYVQSGSGVFARLPQMANVAVIMSGIGVLAGILLLRVFRKELRRLDTEISLLN